MKSAMQEMVEYLESFDEGEMTSDLMYVLEKAKELLPAEREQIERAFTKGAIGWSLSGSNYTSASDYYTQTFTDKNEGDGNI